MKALLVLLLACLAPAAVAQPPTPLVSAAPITIGASYVIRSASLGMDREINVWLPPGYAQNDRRYPVLYVLDGGLDQDFQHIAGLGQLGALSWTYDAMIVVGVKTVERRKELTALPHDPRFIAAFPEAGGAPVFRRFLTEEVIPFIEARHRTSARRALIGESLAGLFTVDTFLSQPGAFTDYIAISPSLWWDNRALTRRAAPLLAQQGASERRLYLAIADEGGTMQTGMDELTAALKAHPPAGLRWSYVDRSAKDTHATIYHVAALEALRTMFAAPPYDYGDDPWFMREDGVPPVKR